MPDPKQIGQDRQYQDAVDAYDAEHGEHKDNVQGTSQDQLLPNTGGAPDPSPFKLGPLG